ncbi:diacylglycerol kinase [Rhizobium helianthi]|uniref:Diacylglycerol kinase n=1 Tax=Rhizobium helianthi TaxID=1132695 RepID=A0ABW4M1L4_9HYPH
MHGPDLPPEKVDGIRHLLAAQRYSYGGFRRLWREAAFRHELLAFAGALALFLAIGAGALKIVILTCLFLFVLALEALNTAVEELVDRVSPEYSLTGRHAKDLGSFAVFCGLLICGIFVLYTLAERLGWVT